MRENGNIRKEVDSLLLGCFALQKLYGREPESFEIISRLFHQVLAEYRGDLIVKAFHRWLKVSPEFPTPADIITQMREVERLEAASIKESEPVMVDIDRLKRYREKGIPLTALQKHQLEEVENA